MQLQRLEWNGMECLPLNMGWMEYMLNVLITSASSFKPFSNQLKILYPYLLY